MDRHSLDALVTGFQDLIESLSLPDPDDRHVLAAAIRAGASAKVTYNLRDFPASELDKYNIEALHPDEFILHQIHLSESKVLQAAQNHRARLKNPPKSVAEYLATLEAQTLPQTVLFLRKYSDLL